MPNLNLNAENLVVKLNIDDYRIIVKQPQFPLTITGATFYNFTGSGATVVTEVQTGNVVDVTVYSPLPTGFTTIWGAITGDINNQTDLINYISGQTSGLTSSWSGLTGLPTQNSDLMTLLSGYTQTGTTADLRLDFNSHSGDTSIHTTMSQVNQAISAATSGLTSSWSGLTGQPTDNSDLVTLLSGYTLTGTTADLQQDFSNHTGDTSIHFHMNDITGFTTTATFNGLKNSFTGHTGDTTIHYKQSGITINQSQVTDLVTDLAGKSGTGHTHPTLYAPLGSYQSHTGDSTIHFTKSSINLDDLGDVQITTPSNGSLLMYTGGTWVDDPAVNIFEYVDDQELLFRNGDEVSGVTQGKFSLSGHTHATLYAPIVHTHVISGVTGLQSALDGKSNTGHTHAYSAITGLPDLSVYQPVSGMSLYQPISGMSIYLTGITAAQITGVTDTLYLHSNALDGYWDSGETMIAITGYSAPIIHTHAYSAITNTPNLSLYQPVSGMSIYLTGITTPMVTGITDSLYAYKIHTHPYSAITNTPNLSLYQPVSGMTDYQPVSGMSDYYTQTQVDSLISGFTTGNTFVASGGTIISQVGTEVTIYSPTGSSSAVVLVGSGATTVDNISGDTWVVYSPTPTGGTGSTVTLIASGACEVNNVSGATWVIYAPSGGTGGSLATLSDVSLSAITNADIIRYDSGTTKWINEAPIDLFANVSNGQTLVRSGTTVVGESTTHNLRKTADQTINGGAQTYVDITDLSFPVVSGESYAFYFYITFTSAVATTGWKAGVNCPTGDLDFWEQDQIIANGTAGVATHVERHNVTRDDMTQLTSTVTANVFLSARIEGRYLCTQTGTFSARFANELAANTDLVVRKGSWGWWF